MNEIPDQNLPAEQAETQPNPEQKIPPEVEAKMLSKAKKVGYIFDKLPVELTQEYQRKMIDAFSLLESKNHEQLIGGINTDRSSFSTDMHSIDSKFGDDYQKNFSSIYDLPGLGGSNPVDGRNNLATGSFFRDKGNGHFTFTYIDPKTGLEFNVDSQNPGKTFDRGGNFGKLGKTWEVGKGQIEGGFDTDTSKGYVNYFKGSKNGGFEAEVATDLDGEFMAGLMAVSRLGKNGDAGEFYAGGHISHDGNLQGGVGYRIRF